MGKRVEYTPASQIRSALRKVFLRSRERARTMKTCGYTCQDCGKKQSRAAGREVYVEAHHVAPIDWSGLIDHIRNRLLAPELTVLCKDCHRKHTREEGGKET